MDNSVISFWDFNDKSIYEILDLIDVSIYWKDINGCYLGANKYMLDMVGLSNSNEIIGKTDYDLIWKDYADKIRATDKLALENHYYSGEEIAITVSNEQRTFMTSKTQLVDKYGKLIILGSSVDITDTKRRMELERQQSILEENAKTMQIIDMVDASIYWKDTEGRFLGCNQYVLDMFGIKDRTEIIGKDEYDLLPVDEARKISSIDMLVLKNGFYRGEEYGTIANSDREMVYLTAKNRLLDRDGNIVGIIGTSIDITLQKEQQRLESEKQALKTENDLFMERALLDDKMRDAVNQLIHDITSPLSSIALATRNIEKLIPAPSLSMLRNAHQRIKGILQLFIRKHTDPDFEYEETDILLASLAVAQIMSEKMVEHHDSGVAFTVDIDKTAAFTFIKLDGGMFKRMVSNLVNNAVEALKGIENPKVKVVLSYTASDNQLQLRIRDNGHGMPLHIQEKFKAGIQVTEGKEHGRGIGLTQIKETLELGNAEYKIHVGKSGGTDITMWFAGIDAPLWVTPEIKLTNEDTIVILDDDKSIHDVWKSIFANILERVPTIKVEYYTDAQEVIDFINGLTAHQKQNIFLLTDYELLGQEINGIDVITHTNMRRAILVTSHANNMKLQDEVLERGVKLLPKELINSIKILVENKVDKWSRKVDMVWVDDSREYVDPMRESFYSHLTVDMYYDPITFMDFVDQYPLDTRIILDTYYMAQPESLSQHGVKYYLTGFHIAQELHNMGYSNIILLAGEKPTNTVPDYLKVLLKGDPEAEQNLDKL